MYNYSRGPLYTILYDKIGATTNIMSRANLSDPDKLVPGEVWNCFTQIQGGGPTIVICRIISPKQWPYK